MIDHQSFRIQHGQLYMPRVNFAADVIALLNDIVRGWRWRTRVRKCVHVARSLQARKNNHILEWQTFDNGQDFATHVHDNDETIIRVVLFVYGFFHVGKQSRYAIGRCTYGCTRLPVIRLTSSPPVAYDVIQQSNDVSSKIDPWHFFPSGIVSGIRIPLTNPG